MGIFIDTYGTANVDMTDGEIAAKVSEVFDMRPYAIETRLKLRNPMYTETQHMVTWVERTRLLRRHSLILAIKNKNLK